MGHFRATRKTSRHVLLLLPILLLPSLAAAADRHVRAGATGFNNGTDWNNAFTALPATLVRGDTYYVADGNYGAYTFNDPVSGPTLIIIRKATPAQHGSNVGWLDTYGDGQAVFTPPLSFDTSHWVFDGARRTNRKSGHGFVVDNSSTNSSFPFHIVGPITNITVRFTELIGAGLDESVNERTFRAIGDTANLGDTSSVGRASNVTLAFSYVHDSANTPIQIHRLNGFTLEHTTVARNSSDPVNHSEAIADSGSNNLTIRFNVFEDIEGTGYIIVLNRGTPHLSADNWDIYGNVFMYSNGNPFNREGTGDGAIACINDEGCNNWRIHNNTFINIPAFSARIAFTQSTGTNRTAQNNLWFNCSNSVHSGTLTASHNYYINTTHNLSEPNVQTSPTTDPFVNWPVGNFDLSRATNAGTTLSFPFNNDPDGVVRGVDGIWDRGAFEFGGTAGPPSPPLNLRTTVQ